jgi:hypothetical protein
MVAMVAMRTKIGGLSAILVVAACNGKTRSYLGSDEGAGGTASGGRTQSGAGGAASTGGSASQNASGGYFPEEARDSGPGSSDASIDVVVPVAHDASTDVTVPIAHDASIDVAASTEHEASIDAASLPSFEASVSVDAGKPWLHVGKLRDTQLGDVVVLDPGRVYAVGTVSNNSYGGYGIAPVDDMSDYITGIPDWMSIFIRPTDGHLLYATLANPSTTDPRRTPLYEFRRSARLYNLTENVVLDGPALCNTNTAGKEVVDGYIVGLDGRAYCICGNWDWYSPQGEQGKPNAHIPLSIGNGGRTLGSALNPPDNYGNVDWLGYTVYDFTTGVSFVTRPWLEGDAGPGLRGDVSTRPRADGFWMSVAANFDPDNTAVQYYNLDLTGRLLNTGFYPPLPDTTKDRSGYNNSLPAIGVDGALYEIHDGGHSIVRRPLSGASTVVWQWNATDAAPGGILAVQGFLSLSAN